MKPILLAAAATALFGPDTPKPIRDQVIQDYFDPPPHSLVMLDEENVKNRGKKDPFSITGSIVVKPPKGHCFTITRRPSLLDTRVCNWDGKTSKKLSFNARDLDLNGRLYWTVQTGPADVGNQYWWKTPHRISKVIPAGERLASMWIPKLLHYCKATTHKDGTHIVVNFVDGDVWTISFPSKHQYVSPQPSPIPNLYTYESKSHGGITASSKIKVQEIDDIVKAKLRARFKEPVQTYWAIPARGNYEIPADYFHVTDVPSGLKGRCRYNFRGAPFERENGWIECHDIANYDVILTRLPCTADLPAP